MLRFLADESFNGTIVKAIRKHHPSIDIVRVQEMNLSGADDPTLLEVAAREHRVLLTQDKRTMPAFLFQRVKDGRRAPAVVELVRKISAARAAEEIAILAECSKEGEWDGQVLFIPL